MGQPQCFLRDPKEEDVDSLTLPIHVPGASKVTAGDPSVSQEEAQAGVLSDSTWLQVTHLAATRLHLLCVTLPKGECVQAARFGKWSSSRSLGDALAVRRSRTSEWLSR